MAAQLKCRFREAELRSRVAHYAMMAVGTINREVEWGLKVAASEERNFLHYAALIFVSINDDGCINLSS